MSDYRHTQGICRVCNSAFVYCACGSRSYKPDHRDEPPAKSDPQLGTEKTSRKGVATGTAGTSPKGTSSGPFTIPVSTLEEEWSRIEEGRRLLAEWATHERDWLAEAKAKVEALGCPYVPAGTQTQPRSEATYQPNTVEGQSQAHSIYEALANISFGFAVSVAANYLILPFYGVTGGASASVEIGLIFTGISFVRSYLFRRVFNWITITKGGSRSC